MRVLTLAELGFVAGGDYGGGGGDADFDNTDIIVTADTSQADASDTQIDFSQDDSGDIVVIGERNMPEGWSDSSWAQVGCKLAGTMAGESDFQSDLVCHVDWSGDNPADPKNSQRLGEIMRNHSDEFFNALDKVQRGVDSRIDLR